MRERIHQVSQTKTLEKELQQEEILANKSIKITRTMRKLSITETMMMMTSTDSLSCLCLVVDEPSVGADEPVLLLQSTNQKPHNNKP